MLCLILPLAALASTNSNWFARSWQTDDGLPNNTVSGIAQTPDGFLWVATPVSLARFDGFQFEDISHTNFVPDPNRGVLALIPSRSGGLWLAMDRGPIVQLNSGKSQLFTTNNGLPDRTAQRLAEDSKGALWIAYRGGAVCRVFDGKVSTFGSSNGVPRGLVYSLAIDREDRVWLAEETNLFRFASGKFEKVLVTHDPITALAPSTQQRNLALHRLTSLPVSSEFGRNRRPVRPRPAGQRRCFASWKIARGPCGSARVLTG